MWNEKMQGKWQQQKKNWWHKGNRHGAQSTYDKIDWRTIRIERRARRRGHTLQCQRIVNFGMAFTRNAQSMDYISQFHMRQRQWRQRWQLWMARNNVLHNSFGTLSSEGIEHLQKYAFHSFIHAEPFLPPFRHFLHFQTKTIMFAIAFSRNNHENLQE